MTESQNLLDNAVQGSNLSFFYEPSQWVFQDLNFSFRKGAINAILGLNGCGKTTLLKIILGVLKPKTGTLKRFGETAFVPQIFQAVFSFRALDMVLMGRTRHVGLFSRPSKKDELLALKAMEKLGIENLALRPYPELSGGQRQLVILARALVSEAKILIFDEPSSALDLGNQVLVLRRMRELSRKDSLTVIFTTHMPQQALSIADEVLLMTAQNSFLAGSTEEILTEENLENVYGIEVKLLEVEKDGKKTKALISLFPDV
ncbi:MAG: ABC transporter ATP-binding protein [Deltaproteobacteria bacterium]|jgi:iron complex transport system ATP-binding protein|nr:ABC transporter ATP-binding protein [Deltaproteobacteria bacterium]